MGCASEARRRKDVAISIEDLSAGLKQNVGHMVRYNGRLTHSRRRTLSNTGHRWPGLGTP